MAKVKDLTGQKFGRWTVIERASSDKDGNARWKCQCECGNIKEIKGRNLRRGESKSCGCLKKEIIINTGKHNTKDLTGQQFGRLIVIKKTTTPNTTKSHDAFWLCKCECGNEKIVSTTNLKNNSTQSCGCYNREQTHKRSYKGGITPITNHLRGLNEQWFINCKQQANYTCQLTGKTGVNLNTHHLKAFSIIVKEAHDLHNIEVKPQVKDYTEEELKLLEEYVASWHKDNSNGIVLSEDVHKLFHSLYGKGNNTPDQYIEFKERYLAGEFDDILSE